MRSSSFFILSLMLHGMAVAAIAMAPQRNFLKGGGSSEVEVSVEPTPRAIPTEEKIDEPKPVIAAPTKSSPAPKPKASVAALLKRKAEPKPEVSAATEPQKQTTAPTETSSTEDSVPTEEAIAQEVAQEEAQPDFKPVKEGVGDGGVEAASEETADSESTGGGSEGGATKQEAVSYLGLKQAGGNKGPSYPESARRENRQGNLELIYRVTKDGKVAEISVAKSSGHSDLDEAAIKAISQFKFVPGQEGWARHPVTFSLKGPDVSQQTKIE